MLLRKSAKAAHAELGFDIGALDSAEVPSVLQRLTGRLKSPGKGKDAVVKSLQQIVNLLEAAPQDAAALGSTKEELSEELLQIATAKGAGKSVQLYSALCIVHLMRICAPELPYSDEELKAVFELLLISWAGLADKAAEGTYEICRETLQTFANVKFFVPLLDLEEPDLLARTFCSLLQAARPENLQSLEVPLLEVLNGILSGLGQPPLALCDAVLSALVGPAAAAVEGKGLAVGPAAQYTAGAQRLAAELLSFGDSALRGAVQGQVLSHVRKGLEDASATAIGRVAAGGGGRVAKKGAAAVASKVAVEGVPCDVLTLLQGLHYSAPLLLLPVVPELKAQLCHQEEGRRAATADLVTHLLAATPLESSAATSLQQQTSSMETGPLGLVTAAPGSAAPVAVQYPELFQELMQRFGDLSPAVRQHMLLRTGQLAAVAAASTTDGALERQVLVTARDRLQDLDERVRGAACRALCSLAAAAAVHQSPPAARGGRGHGALIKSPVAAPPILYDNDMDLALQDVGTRLRDRKVAVRRDAVAGLLVAWRGACTAVQQGVLSLPGLVRSVGWIPARLCAEGMRDSELRPHLMAQLAVPPSPQQLLTHTRGSGGGSGGGRPGPGLLPGSLGQRLGAAVWAALWASYGETERTAVRNLLGLKAKMAADLQQLVELRRQMRSATAAAAAAAAVAAAAPIEEKSLSGSPEDEAQQRLQRLQRRLTVLCQSLARDVGGSADAVTRGSNQMRLLLDSAKDNFFWDRVAELGAPGSTPEALEAVRKDALSRLPTGGSKSPAAELVTRLGATAQPTLLSPSHLLGLLAVVDAAAPAAAEYKDSDDAIIAAANLTITAAKSAPALCFAAMPLVTSILTADRQRPELACTTAVRVLRHAARHCSVVMGGRDAAGTATSDRRASRPMHDSIQEEDSEEEGEEASPPHEPICGKKRAAPIGRGRDTLHLKRNKRETQIEAEHAGAAAVKEDQGSDGVCGGESGGQGGDVLKSLPLALSALSQSRYPKAAKAAVHALRAVLGREEGPRAVAQLAGQLAAQLVPGREDAAVTPAVLQAMGSVGEVAPAVFAEHAEAFFTFVIQLYLLARLRQSAAATDIREVRKARNNSVAAAVGTDWAHPSYGISLKISALRALARGCTPDADAPAATAVPVPAATSAAASSHVTEQLVQLLSVEDDMSKYGALGEADKAHLRLGASCALLHMAHRHDSRLSASSFVAMALTMQDPVLEVRGAFGAQVRQFLVVCLRQFQRPHLISKYAALLPLAGMDPRLEHGEAAARALRGLVLTHRVRAQQAALVAAATVSPVVNSRGGGSSSTARRNMLSDLPEFMLPYLVYILAHHPDCPVAPESWSSQPGADSSMAQGDNLNEEVPEPEDYRPFQDMLQFALESLLAAPPSQQSTGTGGGTGGGAVAAAVAMGNGSDTLPAVCKVLRSVKLQMQVADDSVQPSQTATIRLLCDIGLAVAKAIVERDLTAAAAAACKGESRTHRVPVGGGKAAAGKQPHSPNHHLPSNTGEAAVAAAVSELVRRDHPGHPVVPVRMYALVDSAVTRGIRADGSCLPPGYQVVLNPVIAEMGRRTTGSNSQQQQQRDEKPRAGGGTSGHDAVADDSAAGNNSERDEAGTGDTSQDAERTGKEGVQNRGRGAPKRRAGGAVVGGGDKGEAAPKKGRRKAPAPKEEAVSGGSGRNRDSRGKGGVTAKTSGSPARLAKQKRAGGYESLSEGEPSELTEEEEEEEEEERANAKCDVALERRRAAAVISAVGGGKRAANRNQHHLEQQRRRAPCQAAAPADAYELPKADGDSNDDGGDDEDDGGRKDQKTNRRRQVASGACVPGGSNSKPLPPRQKQLIKQAHPQQPNRQQERPAASEVEDNEDGEGRGDDEEEDNVDKENTGGSRQLKRVAKGGVGMSPSSKRTR